MEWITLADTRNLEYMHTREQFTHTPRIHGTHSLKKAL